MWGMTCGRYRSCKKKCSECPQYQCPVRSVVVDCRMGSSGGAPVLVFTPTRFHTVLYCCSVCGRLGELYEISCA